MKRVLALVVLLLPLTAGAAGYEFHLVAELPTEVRAVAINEAGVVAWQDFDGGVAKGTPGGPTTAIGTNALATGNPRVFIDDVGRVAYWGTTGSADGLFFGASAPAQVQWAEDGTYQGATSGNGGFDIVAGDFFSIDHAGTFAFAGRFQPDPPGTSIAGLFAVPQFGGPYQTTRLVESEDDYFFFPTGLALDGDTVVLSIDDDTDTAMVFRYDGANRTVIADSADGFANGSHMGAKAINSNGDVLFYACADLLPECGLWIEPFAGSAIVVPPVFQAFTNLPSAGAVLSSSPASLTDDGRVAYVGLAVPLVTDSTAIFTGGPVANRVIGRGDALFGNPIDEFRVVFGGMNDARQIAFAAVTSDEQQHSHYVVVRADPVPEPAGELERGAAALAMMFCGVARRPKRAS